MLTGTASRGRGGPSICSWQCLSEQTRRSLRVRVARRCAAAPRDSQHDLDAGSYDTKSAASASRGGLAPWQIRKVSAYIEAHLDSTIGAAHLAGLVKLSVFHFCRAFRASFGEPPHTYVMQRRVERAQGMMLRTSSSLAQIAIECGLADQAHLNKSFRRFVGESPGAWRRARAAPA
jgi:AraC family transcriptional regulator